MAGDAPGREQRRDTSGEVGGAVTADPRLAVFRSPGEGREAEVTERPRGDAAGGAAAGRAGGRSSNAPEPAEVPSSEADREPSAASTDAPSRDTADDVAAVDDRTEPGTPASTPAARAAVKSGPKTESNRDHAEGAVGADEATEAPGAADAGKSSAESGRPARSAAADGPEPAARVTRSQERASSDDQAPSAQSPQAPSAPGRTPVAQSGAPTAGGHQGETPEARSGRDEPAARESRDAAGPAASDGTDGSGDGRPSTGGAGGSSGGTRPSTGTGGSTGSAGSDADAGRTSAGAAAASAANGDAADAEPASAPADDTPSRSTGAAATTLAPPARPAIKPLVSDLPERPVTEPYGGPDSRPGASRAPMAFGTPGTPTKAAGAPQAPASAPGAPSAPLPPANAPSAGRGSTAAPLPPAAPPAAPGGRDPRPPRAADGSGRAQETAEVAGPEGTRRMPIPPAGEQAPLKLLAELTNTPPPPQTALRTVVRRLKIWTPLVVLLAVVVLVVQAVRPLPSPTLALTAATSYTFAGDPLPKSMPWPTQGQSVVEVEGLGSLGTHGTQSPVPIASVTKVMTAYVVLRDHPLSGKENGPLITIDKQAAEEAQPTGDQSFAPVKEGQRFSERTMLQLLLIPSGNNIARLLARWDAGTQDAFVAKMTGTAAALGMTHTTYTGASGIEETTVSTAEDQIRLAREVMKNDVFRSVVSQPNVTISGVGRIFNNNSDLVHVGVVGIKTGSSTPAGGALMWAAHRTIDGKQQLILGVVLQQRGGTTVYDSLQTALQRSQKLIESVQGGLTSATIVKKGEVVGHVDDGLGGSTPVVAAANLTAIGWGGMRSGLTLTPEADGLPHSAKAGTKVGTLSFGAGSARTSVPVVLQGDLHEPSFGTKLTRLG